MWTLAVKSSGITGDPLPHTPTHSDCSMQQTILSSSGRSLPGHFPTTIRRQQGVGGRVVFESRKAHLPKCGGWISPNLGGTPNHKLYPEESCSFLPQEIRRFLALEELFLEMNNRRNQNPKQSVAACICNLSTRKAKAGALL